MARRRTGYAGTLAGVLVMSGVFATGMGLAQATDLLPDLRPFGFAGTSRPPAGPALKASRPVRLAIPAIGVRAPINPVGLAADGTIATPPLGSLNETGWYDQGPTPGQDGPAIILGHVDSKTRPAVFAKLASLRPGQLIEVTRRDQRVAVFQVDSVEQFSKTNLPTSRLYGDFSRPALRLITCGGRWVGGTTGYADNVVVFATLVTSRRA